MNQWKEGVHESPALRTKYQKLLEAYQKAKKESRVLKKVGGQPQGAPAVTTALQALITDQETHKFHESVIKEKEVPLSSCGSLMMH